MALTKDFKDTIQARAQREPAFRKALLQEGVECLLSGDVDTGKAVRTTHSTLPARSSVAKTIHPAPLHRLATNDGEQCGLDQRDDRIRGIVPGFR